MCKFNGDINEKLHERVRIQKRSRYNTMKFYTNKTSLLAEIRFLNQIPFKWDLIRYDIQTARNAVNKKSQQAEQDWIDGGNIGDMYIVSMCVKSIVFSLHKVFYVISLNTHHCLMLSYLQ